MALQSGVVLANATFEEILDDLSSRFIINVPDVELKSVERICFQVEQAHWFYEDFVRELKPELPSFQLKTFSAKIFKHCPLLRQWAHEHERAYADFMQYRFRIPVCGAIMINAALDKCVLVKGWSSKSGWGFPKGKINQDEEYDCCAIREVLEETGYDVEPLLKQQDYIELTMREQRIRLYLIVGVPEDTDFVPRTRKEISEIAWFKFDELPTYKAINNVPEAHIRTGGYRFYMVVPFVSKLKHFVSQRKKALRRQNDGHRAQPSTAATTAIAAAATATATATAAVAAASASAAIAAVTAANEPESVSPTSSIEPEESTDVLKSLLGIGEASVLGTSSPKVYSGSESSASQQQQILVQQQQLQMAQQAKQLQFQLQEQQRQQLHQHQHQQQQQLQHHQHQQQQLQLQLQHHPMASPMQQPGNNNLLQHIFAAQQQRSEPSYSPPAMHHASIIEEMMKNKANVNHTSSAGPTPVESESVSPTDSTQRNNLLNILQGHPGGAPFPPAEGHPLMAMLRGQPTMSHGTLPIHPLPRLFQGQPLMHPQHYDMPFPPPAR